MPPFRVDYFCPRQSPNWQIGKRNVLNFYQACQFAKVLKPHSPQGQARVVDARGNVVYSI